MADLTFKPGHAPIGAAWRQRQTELRSSRPRKTRFDKGVPKAIPRAHVIKAEFVPQEIRDGGRLIAIIQVRRNHDR
jgi:hypothetical protein